MRYRKLFVFAVALQIAVLLVMMGMKWSTAAFGTKILLKTAPVDPWDMFRGDYVVLNYEISELDLSQVPVDKKDFKQNETVWVQLEKQGRYWTPASVSHRRPADGSLAIKGRVMLYMEGQSIPGAQSIQEGRNARESQEILILKYGIESFFVPQHEGKEIEQERRSFEAEVSVDRWGNAALVRLFIDGQEVEWR